MIRYELLRHRRERWECEKVQLPPWYHVTSFQENSEVKSFRPCFRHFLLHTRPPLRTSKRPNFTPNDPRPWKDRNGGTEENGRCTLRGSWEPSKHVHQGEEKSLKSFLSEISDLGSEIGMQVCRDNLQGFLTCWGIQLMTVSFDPRCRYEPCWFHDTARSLPNLGFRIETANVRQQAEKLISPSGFQLFEFCVYSCMYSGNFRNTNMHKRKREIFFTSPRHHGIRWHNPKVYTFQYISPPNVPVQVEMQRQATEEMKQKVGMGWENIYEMNRDEYIRYIECHFESSNQRSTWQIHWKRLVFLMRKNNSLKLLQWLVTLEVIKKYQKIYRDIRGYWLRDFLVHWSSGPCSYKFLIYTLPMCIVLRGIIDPCKDHGIGSRLW